MAPVAPWTGCFSSSRPREKSAVSAGAFTTTHRPASSSAWSLQIPTKSARALTNRDGSHLQPTGAYAANLLGLNDQIPARSEFLTESDERLIQIGNQEIPLRKTTPCIMQMAGKMSGLVTQAFRFIALPIILATRT